jgi:tetratricopeptide (TPR) repeat protein
LRLKLTGEESQRLTRSHTANTTAYQLYLKGRYFWYKRTEPDLEEASNTSIRPSRKKIPATPAYDGLSDSYAPARLAWNSSAPGGFSPGQSGGKKALEIDDSLGEAHASLAHIRLHEWDWTGLDEEFKRALDLNPGHSIAYHWYSEYLTTMGRADESIEIIQKAMEVDPLSPITWVGVAGRLYLARRYDEAIKVIQEGFEVNPNHFLLHLAAWSRPMYK